MLKTHKRRILAASAAALSGILHIKAIAFLLAFSECRFSSNGRSRLGLQALICNNGGSGVSKIMPCVRQQGQLGESIQIIVVLHSSSGTRLRASCMNLEAA